MSISSVLFMALFGWMAAGVWGSVLAFRARKWWATWCMLLGSLMLLLAPLAGIAGRLVSVSLVSGRSPSSPATIAGAVQPSILLALLSMGGIAIGGLLFASGFVAFCARVGATERRAAELETMAQGLQARIQEGP